jgi:hypothetical protein
VKEPTWEEKLEAMCSVKKVLPKMRKPEDWYCPIPGELINESRTFLTSSFGDGRTPEEAVNKAWEICTNNEIKVGSKYLLWNGFMFQDQS